MDDWLDSHAKRFRQFAEAKISLAQRDAGPLRLKLEHSFNVLDTALRITPEIPAQLTRAALLGSLYHDAGRFDQYLQYGTFRDADSCNHGLLSVKTIKQAKWLIEENKTVKNLALTGVALHNRFSLSPRLPEPHRLVAEVIRDADKLDILSVFDWHLNNTVEHNPTVVLSLPDDPDMFSQTVIEAALNQSIASYSDLKSVNDLIILLGSWFFDMHFAQSRRLFAEQRHAENLLARIPADGPHGQAAKKIRAALRDFWR